MRREVAAVIAPTVVSATRERQYAAVGVLPTYVVGADGRGSGGSRGTSMPIPRRCEQSWTRRSCAD
jgi:hypothetical protein